MPISGWGPTPGWGITGSIRPSGSVTGWGRAVGGRWWMRAAEAAPSKWSFGYATSCRISGGRSISAPRPPGGFGLRPIPPTRPRPINSGSRSGGGRCTNFSWTNNTKIPSYGITLCVPRRRFFWGERTQRTITNTPFTLPELSSSPRGEARSRGVSATQAAGPDSVSREEITTESPATSGVNSPPIGAHSWRCSKDSIHILEARLLAIRARCFRAVMGGR